MKPFFSCQSTSCTNAMYATIVESELNRGGASFTRQFCMKHHRRIKEGIQFLRSIPKLLEHHVFGASNVGRIILGMVREKKSDFSLAQVQLWFHLTTRKSGRMSKRFALVRCVKIPRPIHNVNCVLNCFCLRWATEEKADHSVIHSDSGPGTIESR